uniref:Tetraspanin n=1 Tax=Glossina brevipalpis TaxID=37001 RepID=A0A1A9W169_9MUSC
MGCAATTIKISSIILNLIMAIFAIGAIIWISFNPDCMQEELAIIVYIACSLIVFFAFLGCFAAVRESVCLMATCAVFLLILAIVQIIFTSNDISEDGMRNGFSIVNEAWESNNMDEIQIQHECCGKTSANDYIVLSKPVPNSCYVDQDYTKVSNLFTDGCSSKLQTYYADEWWHCSIVSWILIAFELIAFFLAVFLVINFRNTQRRMRF